MICLLTLSNVQNPPRSHLLNPLYKLRIPHTIIPASLHSRNPRLILRPAYTLEIPRFSSLSIPSFLSPLQQDLAIITAAEHVGEFSFYCFRK